jgi:hypothetical protein
MKAAWYEKQGPARDVLVVGEMPDPIPAAGEVRIRIAASGINPGDIKKRENAGRLIQRGRRKPHRDDYGFLSGQSRLSSSLCTRMDEGTNSHETSQSCIRPRVRWWSLIRWTRRMVVRVVILGIGIDIGIVGPNGLPSVAVIDSLQRGEVLRLGIFHYSLLFFFTAKNFDLAVLADHPHIARCDDCDLPHRPRHTNRPDPEV